MMHITVTYVRNGIKRLLVRKQNIDEAGIYGF